MVEIQIVPAGNKQASVKNELERLGYRAAVYWARIKRVTPGQLQRLAEEDLINAVRIEIGKGGRFKFYYYYHEREINKALAILYPKNN